VLRRRYLLFAAEPYEVIAFKVPNVEVEKAEGRLITHCKLLSVSSVLQMQRTSLVTGSSSARVRVKQGLAATHLHTAGDPDNKVYTLQFFFRNRGQ
jgi:hypothetical protein